MTRTTDAVHHSVAWSEYINRRLVAHATGCDRVCLCPPSCKTQFWEREEYAELEMRGKVDTGTRMSKGQWLSFVHEWILADLNCSYESFWKFMN